MSAHRLFPLLGTLLLSGCLFHVRERTDEVALSLAAHAFDPAPTAAADSTANPAAPPKLPAPAEKTVRGVKPPLPDLDIRAVALLQGKEGSSVKDLLPPQLNVPMRIPGAESKLIKLPPDREKLAAEVRRLYPPLDELPAYPRGGPGPEGRPYTLTDLHRMAAANSPTLRQALADVETAQGNMIQASQYPNPTVGYQVDPNNNNSSGSSQGLFVDQLMKTSGKLKIQAAAAQKDLENAQLALKRARSDLATQVRNAYFTFLVARETAEVTRALAQFTDEIYRLQANLLTTGFAAAYEPAALRAQAFSARLAHRQAVENYVYNWKQLAAAVSVRDLPLGEVAGRPDQFIPRFDYNAALAHVLQRHTDVLTARNTVEKQNYNLKLAQVTPVPDIDVRLAVSKETSLPPFTWFHTLQVGIPLPIWDQNRGGILAAEGTLARALQEPKRVELDLTTRLATAFALYRTSRDALETYRKEILPDQVRAYRGLYERRRIDPAAQFGDLVAAQTALAGSVTTYLTTLGLMWSATVSVADLLQTDDLFQMGEPTPLPPLPKLEQLPPPRPVAPGEPAAPGKTSLPPIGEERKAWMRLPPRAAASAAETK